MPTCTTFLVTLRASGHEVKLGVAEEAAGQTAGDVRFGCWECSAKQAALLI